MFSLLFTFDALLCQEKTLKTAKESGNEAIAQVKGKQKRLLNDCQTMAETTTLDEVYEVDNLAQIVNVLPIAHWRKAYR